MIKLDLEDMPAAKIPDQRKAEAQAPTDLKAAYASYMSITYWQQYFDFTQFEILERLSNTVHPQKMSIFESIKAKPDLYVPFWVASSLIFCLFAFGNLSGTGIIDHYNYDYIGSAISLLYGYLIFVPLIVYFVSKIQNSSIEYFNVN
jgi:hypothetical protein